MFEWEKPTAALLDTWTRRKYTTYDSIGPQELVGLREQNHLMVHFLNFFFLENRPEYDHLCSFTNFMSFLYLDNFMSHLLGFITQITMLPIM